MTGNWRGVWMRLGLFGLPFLPLFAFAIFVLFRMGELASLDLGAVVERQLQSRTELLFGPGYSDCTPNFKLRMVQTTRPRVLAVGTSRAMELRAQFFEQPFYNSGGAVFRAGDLRKLLDRIPEKEQPATIILALDQFALNSEVERAETNVIEDRFSRCLTIKDLITANWISVYRDVATKKISIAALSEPPFPAGIGIAARTQGRGFRRDGSNRPGSQGLSPFSEVLDRISRGNYRFQYADDVSPPLVDEIVSFFEEAHRRRIYVVAFLPPYAPEIFDRMEQTGRYGYVKKIRPALAPAFSRLGFALFDFSDTRSLGLTDANFIDGFHGSERAYAVMVAEMGRRDPKLETVIDVGQIERLLRETQDKLFIVPGL